jgi:uncharacterized protein involved in outer membrane biogenesis
MALSRKARIWIIVVSIPIFLLVAAGIGLKMFFTGDRLKAFLIPRIEESTQRTVAIQDISLSLFPTLAVEVDGLSISNIPGKGFSEKPLLQMDKLALDIRLLALLKGNFEVTNVTLERPRLFLEVTESGATNYSQGAATPAGKDSTHVEIKIEAKSEGYGFLLANLSIIDGSMEYVDRKGNSATRMEGMNHTVSVNVPAGANELTIDTKSSVDKFSYGSVTTPLVADLKMSLQQKMVFDVKTGVLKLIPGTATVQAIPLAVSGEVTNCLTLPVMNLLIASDSVSIPQLLSLVPKEYMKKAEGVQGNGIAKAKIMVVGSVTDSTIPDVTGMISATNASIQYPQLPRPITNVNIVADFAKTRTKQEFRMTKFSATLGNNPLGATMTVVNFDDPALTMTLTAALNLAEVKQFYPLEAGTEMSGTLKADVNVDGKVSNPAAMKAKGNMVFDGVTMKTASSPNPVRNLNGTISFNNQVIEAKKLSMNIGKSDLALSFAMKNYLSMMSEDKKAPKPTATLSLSSDHLYTADIMGDEQQQKSAQQAAPQQSAAKPDQPVKAGSSQPAGKKAQSAQAAVPLPNVDMDVAATIGTLTMEKLEMKNVKGTMKISNGIVALQNFTCKMYDGTITTKGTLNMQKPDHRAFDLAFDMNGVDANGLLPKFTSFGERMFGTLSMSTTMKGTLNDTLGIETQGLTGAGKASVAEGKLTGVKVNKAVASLVKLPDLEEINFKEWANSFTIADGRIVIKDLKIAALGADYLINGSQGLDGSLDYGMSMLLSEKSSAGVAIPGFAGEAAKLFKEPNGRVKLDFAVGGTYEAPKVSLDTKPAQKRAEDLAKQKVNDEAKKLGEEAKKKAGDVLKDLFKKKK